MTKRILLTDDDEAFRESVKEILLLEDYDITEANNGLEAINLLKDNEYDLLITDILMPKVEGLELSTQLRELGIDIKTIGMTGGGQLDKDNIVSFATGFFDACLTKPFTREEILKEVDKLI